MAVPCLGKLLPCLWGAGCYSSASCPQRQAQGVRNTYECSERVGTVWHGVHLSSQQHALLTVSSFTMHVPICQGVLNTYGCAESVIVGHSMLSKQPTSFMLADGVRGMRWSASKAPGC